MIEMRTIQPDDGAFRLFDEVVRQLYPDGSLRFRETEHINWPAFQFGYVALIDGRPLARAVLYQQPGLGDQGHGTRLIGNYECADDDQLAAALLDKVANDARNSGGTYLIGPMNGSTWDNYRFSTTHNHPNFLLEPYHHLYYQQQFSKAGFEIISRYSSRLDTTLYCDSETVLEKELAFACQGITIRSIRTDRFDDELERLHPFIETAFSNNFLYSSIDANAFRAKYRAVIPLLDPELVLLAENRDREIVGFIFSYEDLYRPNGKSLVVKTLARHPAAMYGGLGHVLANRVVRHAKQTGFTSVIHAFIIDQGAATTVSGNFLGIPYKEYVLYGKTL